MNQPPLNPDALEAAAVAINSKHEHNLHIPWGVLVKSDDKANRHRVKSDREYALAAVSAYLTVAQPVVNRFNPRELNRKGWTCGCEPGNYEACDECQSACNELANFLNRPEVPGA